jgi:hypothetical protein
VRGLPCQEGGRRRHAIYRPAGRINNPGALLTMVERCNTELNLGLFPEDVAAVAAVLQRDHYRFPAQPALKRPAQLCAHEQAPPPSAAVLADAHRGRRIRSGV